MKEALGSDHGSGAGAATAQAVAKWKVPDPSGKSLLLDEPDPVSPGEERSSDVETLLANNYSELLALHAPYVAPPAMPINNAPADPLPKNPIGGRTTPQDLDLDEFEVTRFEYKAEYETPPMEELPVAPVFQPLLQMVRISAPLRETRAAKTGDKPNNASSDTGAQAQRSDAPVHIAGADAVQHVQLVFEPPPPPPMVRSVSMDIGDDESQVRVVIRERNGDMSVRIGSSDERLRDSMQASSSLLMQELRRDNPQAVTLDFTNFGSATEADRQPRSQSPAKKVLKPGAEFADVAETSYLSTPASSVKSL